MRFKCKYNELAKKLDSPKIKSLVIYIYNYTFCLIKYYYYYILTNTEFNVSVLKMCKKICIYNFCKFYIKDIQYKMTFYSQCGEDKFLYEKFFSNKKNGVYIELGAVDGVFQSNTKFFEDELGWKGILIEPHEKTFEQLKLNRPNNYLFNDLVSCETEELEYKYMDDVVAVAGVSNTLTQYHSDEWYDKPGCLAEKNNWGINTKLIKPKTLTEIIKSTDIQSIDLFSLDVEGHEYEILKSWDFSVPISVIIIEMLGMDDVAIERENLCKEILTKNGYVFDCKVGCSNEVYVLQH